MKKLILVMLLVCSAMQAQVNVVYADDIYGEWLSWDGEQTLYMNYVKGGDTFLRQSPTGPITGKFSIEDNYLVIKKKKSKYRLMFKLKGIQLIVVKPVSEGKDDGQAWLFTKISNNQTEY